MSTQRILAAERVRLDRYRPPVWRRHIHGSELAWAVAFIVPYVGVLLAFAVFPIAYGFWMAGDPALYATLFSSEEYVDALISTALYVGIGANASVFLALLLSGFFMRRGWWVKALLVLSMLPWVLPAQTAFMSFHWMMIYWGFLNSLLEKVFGVAGPDWLSHYWLALGANVVAYTWKTMPLWTLIFLAGRMAVSLELYEAAEVDGASRLQKFRYVTLPLMAGMYLVCTMLSTIWALGDFNAVRFISGGGPALSTHVLATLGIRNAFELGDPHLGMATVLTALPLLIPLVILLMRQLRRNEVTI